MLTILNNYTHGYVAIPVIIACKKHGLFKHLKLNQSVAFTELVKKLQANSGNLRLSLHILEFINWVYRDNEDGYTLTPVSEIYPKIPEGILKLMSFPTNEYLKENQKKYRLRKWINLSSKRWEIGDPTIADFLDGMMVIPLLIALQENELFSSYGNEKALLLSELNPSVQEEIRDVFINRGWLVPTDGGTVLTETGSSIIERIDVIAEVASFKSVLSNISEIIFGDCKNVFERDFHSNDMEKIFRYVFNRNPYKKKLRCIADYAKTKGLKDRNLEEVGIAVTEHSSSVKEFIVKTILLILGKTKEEAFSLDRPIMEMGLDSEDLLELAEQVSYKYNVPLKPAFFFTYNTADRIISYLQERVGVNEEEDSVIAQEIIVTESVNQKELDSNGKPRNTMQSSDAQNKDIAIVGIGCRLPGGIKNQEQLWELLINGEDAIRKMPSQRWEWPSYIDLKNEHKGIDLGGFLEEIDNFDPLFFRISPKEAELIDPQQRILLELSWECLEDAGYSAKTVFGSKTGVFIGASGSDYNALLNRYLEKIDSHYGTGTSMAMLPNRISYFYDFHGPSIQIDTACSSSLVAIHEAVKSLQDGECEQAMVGGINIMCYPSNSITYYKAGMLAKDGRCKTFDKDANGYVRGEGAVMMLLKPLKAALADRDCVYAVIKGAAVNHGGQAGGLTVPNPAKQSALLVEAYKSASVEPETVGYIETHGTGTSLGDPIEINGLKEAFCQLSIRNREIPKPYCGIGSIKTNIGHLEAAAGIVGLLKVVLSMRYQTIPASLNFNKLNSNITLSKSPFYVVDKNKPWQLPDSQLLRRAGVSSFGSGGTNAHVVLEEAPVAARPDYQKLSCYLICLSAKTEEALIQKQKELALWLDKEGQQHNLTDISATLILRREHFGIRSAFVIRDINELRGKFKEVLENGQAEGYFRETTSVKGKPLQPLFAELGRTILKDIRADQKICDQDYNNKIMALAELYIKGYDLDWTAIYADKKMLAVSLPHYPFARERYWIPGLELPSVNGESSPTAATDASIYINHSTERKICILKKQWEFCKEVSSRTADRTIAILTTQETSKLAAELSGYFNKTHILSLYDLESQLQQPEEQWKNYEGCVDLTGCGKEPDELQNWIAWFQQLIENGHRKGLMILGVTKGLESYQNTVVNLSGASRAGLYRMLQSEYGHVRSRHMDTDLSIDDKMLPQQIVSEFLMNSEDPEICYREGKRYRACLKEIQEKNHDEPVLEFPEGHVLWITGGTRGLGLLCARHYVMQHGIKRLVLTGRETFPPRKQWDSYQHQNSSIAQKIKAVQALEDQGAQVHVLSVSLTDEQALKQSVAEVKNNIGPIGGVIHCAGLADTDNPAFVRKSPEGILRVTTPKIGGLDVLYQSFRDEPLQFFVLFSSVSAVIPTLAVGRSDYAMANAYMDYVAEANTYAYPVVSIQWPSWKQTGMGEVKNRSYLQTGLLSITDKEGLQLLDYILAKKIGPVVLPAVINPDLWNPNRLIQRTIKENIPVGPEVQPPVQAVLLKDPDVLVRAIREWLLTLFSKELKIDYSKLEIDKPVQNYGVDSILLAQLLRSINELITEELDPSILLEFPTIELLASWLKDNYGSSLSKALGEIVSEQHNLQPQVLPSTCLESDESVLVRTNRIHSHRGTDLFDIAVIGMSCRFPGSGTLKEYWQLLSKGRSAIGSVPRERWGYSNGFYAGLLDDIVHFDSKFFLISEEDARAMDPQALLTLEESLKLWYHAGYSLEEIKGKQIGVYLGARSQHRPDQVCLLQAKNPIVAFGQNYLAANISHFFDLRGPSIVVDTACSSALTGMNIAIQDLHSGEIESALVGGVSLLTTDEYHRIFQQRNILSPSASFHIFDQRAQGVVLGEGVGLVLLKKLEQALLDGDHIYAVIKAISINNDGRTVGPATPNLQAQKEVMQAALGKSGKNPDEFSYIEVNGSGSEVTDLLELKALQSIYGISNKTCGLGSIKPNIGHPLCAEGIASFIKVVLMLHHRQLVPFLSGERPIKHYDLNSSPFYFCQKLTPWIDTPRVAAINCFADGGTNAHVILESWEDQTSYKIKRQPITSPELSRYDICSTSVWKQEKVDISLPVLKNHRAYGQALLPGLAYIQMLYQLFKEKGHEYNRLELRNFSIYNPLTVGQEYHVLITIECKEVKDGQWEIRIEGQEQHNGLLAPDKKLYVTAEMHRTDPILFNETLDIEQIKRSAKRIVSLDDVYEKCRHLELVHTGFMKAEGNIYEEETANYIDISLGQDAVSSAEDFVFHPVLVDGSAIGSRVVFGSTDSDKDQQRLFLPLFYESFRASELLQTQCITRIQTSSMQRKKELSSVTMEFFNKFGEKVGELKNFINKFVRNVELINPNRTTTTQSIQDSQPISTGSSSVTPLSSDTDSLLSRTTQRFLKQVIASQLQRSVDEIDSQIGYYEMGLNSSMLLEVVKGIEAKLSTQLTPTLLFEYTTIAELADYLSDIYPDRFGQEPVEKQSPIPNALDKTNVLLRTTPQSFDSMVAASEDDIAIIGMAGRYAAAENLNEFWRNLREGKNCIGEIPKSRWNWQKFKGIKSPSGKNMSRWGGFINYPDCFDAQFFRISPREAEQMDPQERLFLEVCWEAIEDAGYTPRTLVTAKGPNKRRHVGVFAGVMHKDYTLIQAESMLQGQAFPISLNYALIANRVSYFCNFHGPSMAIDTVCSSSLVATHLAIESLRRGESEVALAGGVNLSLHPNKYITYGLMDMHASDGYCHTFGKGGDGYVSGEGIGIVLLKPLRKAIQDQDNIYAVIKGSAINHGGTVSGVTVPSPVAQADMILGCLNKTRIDPRTISYVEAHGTGTSLGDPIEVQGLVKAFRHHTKDRQFCSIGSVKSNIGHAESAAGISGLHKVALQLYHKTLVPSLHSEELNPHISFEQSPFYVQHKTEEWKQPVITENGQEVRCPRRAGLSSFGAYGSNAHIILEEFVPEEEQKQPPVVIDNQPTPVIIPLSAKNKERLHIYAGKLLDFLSKQSLDNDFRHSKEEKKIELREILVTKIRGILSRCIHVQEDTLEIEQEWTEYGMEPVHMTGLKEKIYDEFKIEIDISELLQINSIASAVDFIIENHQEDLEDNQVFAHSIQKETRLNTIQPNLSELVYTLQVGREPMEERVAFVVRDISELIQKLESFVQNKNGIEQCYQGYVKQNKDITSLFATDEDTQELINKWMTKGKIEKLAELWVKGFEVNWALLYGVSKPRRMSLPTYPFARERYWVSEIQNRTTGITADSAKVTSIHPLLQLNTSDFFEQRFSSTFTGQEFFLADHVLEGQRVLPGVVYLEMARAAVTQAAGVTEQGRAGMRLENILWARPVAIGDQPVQVHIGLYPEENGEVTYEIYSDPEEGGTEPVVHCQGIAVMGAVAEISTLELKALQHKCNKIIQNSTEFYEAVRTTGTQYSPAYQGIEEVYVQANQVLAKLSLPPSVLETQYQFNLHPSLIESALQASLALRIEEGNTMFSDRLESFKMVLPYSLQELEIVRTLDTTLWALINYSDSIEDQSKLQKLDIVLCNDQGAVCLRMKGFTTIALER